MNHGVSENLRARKAITDAFFELLVQKKFSDITISDIVRKSGVARTTYYHNYYYKEDIIEDFMNLTHQQLMAAFKIDKQPLKEQEIRKNLDPKRLVSSFERSFQLFLMNKSYLLLIYNNGFSKLIQNMVNQYAQEIFQKLNISNDYQIYFIAGAFANVQLAWLEKGARESPHEMAEILVTLLDQNNLQQLIK